jgi:hypothetical protein
MNEPIAPLQREEHQPSCIMADSMEEEICIPITWGTVARAANSLKARNRTVGVGKREDIKWSGYVFEIIKESRSKEDVCTRLMSTSSLFQGMPWGVVTHTITSLDRLVYNVTLRLFGVIRKPTEGREAAGRSQMLGSCGHNRRCCRAANYSLGYGKLNRDEEGGESDFHVETG